MEFKFDHIVLNVVDIEKMLDFYLNVLQLPGERLEEYAAGQVPFPSVRLSKDSIIDLFPKKLWGKTSPDQVCRPNLNHFCITTDETSVQALQSRLVEKGVAINEGPVKRWGAHGTGISIYLQDPEKNTIEIRFYKASKNEKTCLLGS